MTSIILRIKKTISNFIFGKDDAVLRSRSLNKDIIELPYDPSKHVNFETSSVTPNRDENRIAADVALTEHLAEEKRRKQKYEEKRYEEIQAEKKGEEERAAQRWQDELEYQKKLASQKPSEDLNKIYSDEKERLIDTEQKSRFVDEQILTEIPKEEIEILENEILDQIRLKNQQISADTSEPVQENVSQFSSNFASEQIYPKKCRVCPEHKNYFEGEIHLCPDCERWFCGRHYHQHVIKEHGSKVYRVTSKDLGHHNIRFPK
jgi:hypothetical protein